MDRYIYQSDESHGFLEVIRPLKNQNARGGFLEKGFTSHADMPGLAGKSQFLIGDTSSLIHGWNFPLSC